MPLFSIVFIMFYYIVIFFRILFNFYVKSVTNLFCKPLIEDSALMLHNKHKNLFLDF